MATIDHLPIEILPLIFSQIGDNIQEQVQELCKVERVCKKWREAASSDQNWLPLLKEICPRGYNLGSEIDLTNISIKSIFVKIVNLEIKNQLEIAFNLINNEELSSAYRGNKLQRLSLIKNDATSFLEELIDKKIFEILLSFLLKDICFNHKKIFEKLLLVDFQTDINVGNHSFYFLVLKHFLSLKLDFSSVFAGLDHKHSFQLQEIMSSICIHQNVSILRFVESGLNPNYMLPVSRSPTNTGKIPLVYFFFKACFSDPIQSQQRYEGKLRSMEATSEETQKKIKKRGEAYGVDLMPPPITQEELLNDFQIFLKMKELEINNRNIRGNTILFAVRHMKSFENADLIFLTLIEELLLKNGAS